MILQGPGQQGRNLRAFPIDTHPSRLGSLHQQDVYSLHPFKLGLTHLSSASTSLRMQINVRSAKWLMGHVSNNQPKILFSLNKQ